VTGIGNIIKRSFLGAWVAHFYPYAFIRHRKDAMKYLEKAFPDMPFRFRNKIVRRMVRVFCTHHFYFDEFLCYGLYDLKRAIDPEWLADYDRMHYVRILNSINDRSYFANKYATYIKFKKFYHRDVCMVSTLDEGLDFCYQHKTFIAKPIDGSLGRGVRKVVLGNDSEIKDFLTQFCEAGGGVGGMHKSSC